jgi:hypothetical protein
MYSATRRFGAPWTHMWCIYAPNVRIGPKTGPVRVISRRPLRDFKTCARNRPPLAPGPWVWCLTRGTGWARKTAPPPRGALRRRPPAAKDAVPRGGLLGSPVGKLAPIPGAPRARREWCPARPGRAGNAFQRPLGAPGMIWAPTCASGRKRDQRVSFPGGLCAPSKRAHGTGRPSPRARGCGA